MKNKKRKTETYIFHREGMWYPVELYDDKDAVANALHNKGTLKVTNLIGRTIWEAPKHPTP